MSDYQSLLALAGSRLAAGPAVIAPQLASRAAPHLLGQLEALLTERNGFFAFDRALHVFPATTATGALVDLNSWNEPARWIDAYGDLARGCLFFAEDVFGGQFCMRESGIYSFDPETGELESLGDSLESWANAIVKDPGLLTGYVVAREWQNEHGPLAEGHRLVPIVPFTVGGDYEVSNLRSMTAAEGMRFRGQVALQIRELPDGTAVEILTSRTRR